MYRNVDVPFEKTQNYGNLSSSELFPLPHILLPYRQFTNFSYNHKLFIIAKRINKMKKNFFLSHVISISTFYFGQNNKRDI